MKRGTALSYRVSLISRLQRKRFDRRARALGVTLSQWRAINAISQEAGASQRRVAEILEIGDVATGRLIDRMKENGWVERHDDPADRRTHRLYLTPGATALLGQLSGLAASEEKLALEAIDPVEAERIVTLLDQVIDNLERAHRGADGEDASGGVRPPPSSRSC